MINIFKVLQVSFTFVGELTLTCPTCKNYMTMFRMMAVVLINDYFEFVQKDEESPKEVMKVISDGIRETETLRLGIFERSLHTTVQHIGKFKAAVGLVLKVPLVTRQVAEAGGAVG